VSRRVEPRARRNPARDRSRGLSSSGPIRAVLFDAGATLLHPSPPVEEIYARELAVDGARFSREELDSALSRAWEEVHSAASPSSGPDRYGGVRGEAEFWRAFLNGVRARLDGGEVSAEAFARLAVHFRDPGSWRVYPDVNDTLDELARRGVPLGIVSNWDSHLPKLLDALGLASRFATVAVSAIEETGKPHPEIFHRACARLTVAPGEALHVGDSVREDYEGAKAAGLSALLLDREGRYPDAADRIASLDGVLKRVG
jgi:putative hydrolase of the HAD superfamily